MKKIIFLLFLCLISCSDKKNNFSKNKEPDSLSVYFSLANLDTLQYEKRLEYAEKAYDLIKNQENDSMHRVYLFRVANRYYNMRNFEDYKKITRLTLEKSEKAKDTVSLAKGYSYLADFYREDHQKFDSAFIYYVKAEKLFRHLDDNKNLGVTHINFSMMQIYQNDSKGAESSAIQALNFLKNVPEKFLMYEAYNIIAVASYNLGDFEKSLEYNTKALNLAKIHGGDLKENSISSSLNNIGVLYQKQNMHSKAIENFKEALKCEGLNYSNPRLHSILLNNLAHSKFKSNDYSELPHLFYKSIKIHDSLKLEPSLAINPKIHLSEFYIAQKDTLKAQKYIAEALSLSRKTKSSQDIMMCLQQFMEVDPKNAIKYSKEFIAINDSVILHERKSQNRFARLGFETDEIILQKEIAIQRQWLIFIISISLILLGLLLYIIRIQRVKQKESLLIQSQQKASEEIYQLILDRQIQFNEGREKEKKRIAKELHDGVMNKLSGIRFNLFVLQKKTDPETIAKCISHISEIKSVEKEIRNITHDLHQDVFSAKNDYSELVRALATDLDESVEINSQVNLDENINWENVPALLKMHSYRILQESISNVVKHSNAKNLYVNISQSSEHLVIEIKDDGKGFDTTQESSSLGLNNIKYRTIEMEGKFEIFSSEKGTSIILKLPLQ